MMGVREKRLASLRHNTGNLVRYQIVVALGSQSWHSQILRRGRYYYYLVVIVLDSTVN